MDTQQAFLQAIIEEPEDDTHRLVFADWLDEHDRSAWAALIRAQCALHPMLLPPHELYSAPGLLPVDHLTEVTQQQVLTLLNGLLSPVAQLAQPPWSHWFRWRVQRGMIEGVELWAGGLEVFIEHAERIFRRLPLTNVILRTYQRPMNDYVNIARESFVALLRIPEVARLQNLDVRAHAVSYQLAALAEFGERFVGGRVWAQGYPITSNEAPARRVRDILGERLVVCGSHPDNPSDEIPF